MQLSLLDSLTRQLSINAIANYQKHISPHKGFACAHRILYGGESCSQYIKRVISEEGVSAGWHKSRARFQACKQANLILRSPTRSQINDLEPDEPSEQPTSPQRGRRYQHNSCDHHSMIDCASSIPDCGDLGDCNSLDCGINDCSSGDCHSLDCGSGDCSSLDCGSGDCGSCGN
ncbi:membrane protein insertion efficiency factor YidD [Nostoc sp. TCL26-01]|uniref:membrane protein insertion efficiency factor YidD n=1 Tax=Nostoc sp. TCL26-01 TaxID=2576904 RepID=UPI0015B800A3|nr:membrane protein insertion efficiency factor YidD [Nostoc sp. TCL26-01]QLE54565.1 membrane protein insertion efficiency factor YidD [Nostoc sp. TCL26-01]